MKKQFLTIFIAFGLVSTALGQSGQVSVFEIGDDDNSATGMALAPNAYENFLAEDFGWEDRYFLVGHSKAETSWPYVLPGPADQWGGTSGTSGIRSHVLNILFGVKDIPAAGSSRLVIDLLGFNGKPPPLFKVKVNGHSWKYQLPQRDADSTIVGKTTGAGEYKIEVPVKNELLKEGGNEINLTTIRGSWLVFDQVRLEGPGDIELEQPGKAFVRDVQSSDYEIDQTGKRAQPLLVDVEHLKGTPQLRVELDGEEILNEILEKGRYTFEAPMPAVESQKPSRYKVFLGDEVVRSGRVTRTPAELHTPAEYVDTMMGAAHSRWMIAPGPWMPFSMVKLSPDNQNAGWQAGYDPTFESVGAFSHIHEWTMSGLGMLPVNGPLKIKVGDQGDPDSGYRSRIDKSTEEAPLGYYKVDLTDYNITAEMTATTRAGFQRYRYPKDKSSRVMIDLKIPAEYDYQIEELEIKKVSDHRIEGYSKQFSPNTWSGGVSQEYKVHFVIEFDQPIQNFGVWKNDEVMDKITLTARDAEDAGAFVEFDTRENQVVQTRSGISLVSIENASENLEVEITEPFGWDFEAVQANQEKAWNDLLGRVEIRTNDQREKKRFYTNMYRAMASRNTWNDVNGEWTDATEEVRKFDDPGAVALGCDAFWNTFWNLNQMWNLVTPEWSSRWVKSQLAMYEANGWLAKGPAGMEYVPVMVAEHEIPLIVGAYQMGIRDYDVQKAFEAVYKMQTTKPQKVGGGLAGNRDLATYLEHQYVPYDEGRFSNTLEYSFDDWTVAQFAKSLGKTSAYKEFRDRGSWWKNVIDKESGYARMKDSKGNWLSDFDPFRSGSNEHYVEGNAWQLTYYVPQEVPELAQKIGKDRFIERLDWGFTESYKWRFNAPNDQYWDYPVIQGNQQSMHFAFLFNWVGRPWLTQKWSRAIMDRYYGYGVANAYLGDEDQGQMSAWFVMNAIGLFQTDGGTRMEPVYEIGSPIFERIEIDLGGRYGRGKTFVIEAENTSRINKYVQSATLNGKRLNSFKFPAQKLLNGGELVLEMGPEPNRDWGVMKESGTP